MHLCPKPASDHSTHGGTARSAPCGYCQNLSQRERLCCVREVQTSLQYPYPVLNFSLHCHLHHSMCPTISHHSDTQVRIALCLPGGGGGGQGYALRMARGHVPSWDWCGKVERKAELDCTGKHSDLCLLNLLREVLSHIRKGMEGCNVSYPRMFFIQMGSRFAV